MSTQITTAFVEQYRDNIIMLSQQKGARLRSAVRSESVVGKNAFFDRIGATAAIDAAGRHDDTPQIDTPHSRRRVSLVTSRWADLIDNPDKVRMLINPESDYAMNAVWAMGRKMDDRLIAAASGNSYTGVDGSTVVALPSAQKIVVNATGLTLAKLILAKEALDSADVDPEIPRYIAVTSKMISTLLNTTEVKSADYNTVKTLVQGDIDSFMGFKFIRTQRLALDGSGDRLALAWISTAMVLAVGSEPRVRISERDDKNYSTQVFVEMDIGATRLEDEGVVEIACDE